VTSIRTQTIHVVGYSFEGSSGWTPTTFSANRKYIVRRLKPGESNTYGGIKEVGPQWGVFEFTDGTKWAGCNEPYKAAWLDVSNGNLICRGQADVTFDRNTLRFELIMTGAYVTPDTPESNGDTPSITIGKCSAF